jgi:hypothetical protein
VKTENSSEERLQLIFRSTTAEREIITQSLSTKQPSIYDSSKELRRELGAKKKRKSFPVFFSPAFCHAKLLVLLRF